MGSVISTLYVKGPHLAVLREPYDVLGIRFGLSTCKVNVLIC